MNTRTLPDGSTITYTGHSRLWVLTDGTALRSEGYGPWEHSEPLFPAQRCPGCGAEHPGQPCNLQDDLFGGAA